MSKTKDRIILSDLAFYGYHGVMLRERTSSGSASASTSNAASISSAPATTTSSKPQSLTRTSTIW